MDAVGFQALAGLVDDRPVVTTDPRGAGRNPAGEAVLTPEQHAEDLHRVIAHLGVGAVDVFASSGGAVNTLALVAAHPGDVHRVDALRARGEDVLLAVEGDSGETFAARAARSVAAAPGQEAVVLPGDHGGFMGAVHGRPAGRPEESARRLVQLLG
jgi:pimeloyl-ACP methyl ester carboxylesterase